MQTFYRIKQTVWVVILCDVTREALLKELILQTCPKCQRVFRWPAHMQEHRQTHDKRVYKCPEFEWCSKKVPSGSGRRTTGYLKGNRTNFRIHLDNVHADQPGMFVLICYTLSSSKQV